MSLIRINHHPAAAQLRVFSIAFLFVFGAIGVRFARHDLLMAARVLWGAALMVGAVGLIVPRAVRLLYVGLSYATFPVGWTVSHAVLGVLYFGVLTPLGLIVRLCGHDALKRKFDRRAATYWTARPQARPAESYFRQSGE